MTGRHRNTVPDRSTSDRVGRMTSSPGAPHRCPLRHPGRPPHRRPRRSPPRSRPRDRPHRHHGRRQGHGPPLGTGRPDPPQHHRPRPRENLRRRRRTPGNRSLLHRPRTHQTRPRRTRPRLPRPRPPHRRTHRLHRPRRTDQQTRRPRTHRASTAPGGPCAPTPRPTATPADRQYAKPSNELANTRKPWAPHWRPWWNWRTSAPRAPSPWRTKAGTRSLHRASFAGAEVADEAAPLDLEPQRQRVYAQVNARFTMVPPRL